MNELRSAESEEAAAEVEPALGTDSLIEGEDLLEEISIDGMCGVY